LRNFGDTKISQNEKNQTQSAAYIFMCLLFCIAVSSCKKDQSGTTQTNRQPPTVTSISPKKPQPGDVVTITGKGFGSVLADVKVTIGTQVIPITTVSDTEIKFTLPADITAGDLALVIKNIAANKDPQGATITPQPARLQPLPYYQ
jgi:hypothetical protein